MLDNNVPYNGKKRKLFSKKTFSRNNFANTVWEGSEWGGGNLKLAVVGKEL
jgi:hypothetical protein